MKESATANEETRDSDGNDGAGTKSKKMSRRRFAWIGITLSALLWFTSDIYLQKTLRFMEVELQSGSLSQAEYDSILLSNRRYYLACKIGSSVLLLGSILYLISQLETRHPPHAGRQMKGSNKPSSDTQTG